MTKRSRDPGPLCPCAEISMSEPTACDTSKPFLNHLPGSFDVPCNRLLRTASASFSVRFCSQTLPVLTRGAARNSIAIGFEQFYTFVPDHPSGSHSHFPNRQFVHSTYVCISFLFSRCCIVYCQVFPDICIYESADPAGSKWQKKDRCILFVHSGPLWTPCLNSQADKPDPAIPGCLRACL